MTTTYATFLTGDDLRQVHEASLEILEHVGMLVRNEKAHALFARHGCLTQAGSPLVKFPRRVIEEFRASMPPTFTFHARDPRFDRTLPKDAPVIITGSSAPNLIDPVTGKERRATSEDIARIARLVNELPGYDVFSISTLAEDAPPGYYSLARLMPTLKNCLKPLRISSLDEEDAGRTLRLGALVAGSEAAYRDHPFITHHTCPVVSPLTFDVDSTEMLLYYVERGGTELLPLAVEAPGNDIGFSASWSLNGRYVVYKREALFSELWLVDMQTPSAAVQVAEHVVIDCWDWLADEKALIYSADYSTVVKVDLATLDTTPLRTFEQELGEYFLFELAGQTLSNGYLVVERREINRQLDPAFQKLIYIDLLSGSVMPLLEGMPMSTAVVLPGSDKVWITDDDTRQGWIAELPSGQVIAGPSSTLYPPTSVELEILPDLEDVGDEVRQRSRSPDLHLWVGYRGDDLVVWDVQSGRITTVAPEFEGRKVFLGWDPTPED